MRFKRRGDIKAGVPVFAEQPEKHPEESKQAWDDRLALFESLKGITIDVHRRPMPVVIGHERKLQAEIRAERLRKADLRKANGPEAILDSETTEEGRANLAALYDGIAHDLVAKAHGYEMEAPDGTVTQAEDEEGEDLIATLKDLGILVDCVQAALRAQRPTPQQAKN